MISQQMKDKFGRWLNNELYRRKMSVKDFVTKSGINQSTVSNYVNGLVMPGLGLLIIVANTFGVRIGFKDDDIYIDGRKI